MRIVVIGGTGHIGTYLIPRLVMGGHEVTVITRGQRQPYLNHPTWKDVQRVEINRTAAEQDGTFGQRMRALKPEVVMDMLCFTVESAQMLVEALRGEIQLLAHCGTIWVNGYTTVSPTTEDQPRTPLEAYGINKNAIEAYLLDQAHRTGFPTTALHPGHIVGPGHPPVGPTACHDTAPFGRLARGEEVALPNLGLETVHHVHADDVAQAFVLSMTHWSQAVGEGFFIVSPAALTLRGFAEAAARWFGREANLRFLPQEAWLETIPDEFKGGALAHLQHSTHCSIAKAEKYLGYQPRYSSLEAVHEAVMWLVEHGKMIVK